MYLSLYCNIYKIKAVWGMSAVLAAETTYPSVFLKQTKFHYLILKQRWKIIIYVRCAYFHLLFNCVVDFVIEFRSF